MKILGLTPLQSEVVQSTAKGESYLMLADRLDTDEMTVMKAEAGALAILVRRWRRSEAEVKDALKALFLLVLCLLPSLEGVEVERALRVRTTRTREGGRREFVDPTLIDV